MAGDRRCGAKDRLICAVTTMTDAMPRRPYTFSLVVDVMGEIIELYLRRPRRHLFSVPVLWPWFLNRELFVRRYPSNQQYVQMK